MQNILSYIPNVVTDFFSKKSRAAVRFYESLL